MGVACGTSVQYIQLVQFIICEDTNTMAESNVGIQRRLQSVVLRAAVGGYTLPIETAVEICTTDRGVLSKSSSNDILDVFPENLNVKVWHK